MFWISDFLYLPIVLTFDCWWKIYLVYLLYIVFGNIIFRVTKSLSLYILRLVPLIGFISLFQNTDYGSITSYNITNVTVFEPIFFYSCCPFTNHLLLRRSITLLFIGNLRQSKKDHCFFYVYYFKFHIPV